MQNYESFSSKDVRSAIKSLRHSRFKRMLKSYSCDVMPLAASSQGHRPDRGRECSGWSSQIGERLHPLLFNYL